jgi:hypothetical protein
MIKHVEFAAQWSPLMVFFSRCPSCRDGQWGQHGETADCRYCHQSFTMP